MAENTFIEKRYYIKDLSKFFIDYEKIINKQIKNKINDYMKKYNNRENTLFFDFWISCDYKNNVLIRIDIIYRKQKEKDNIKDLIIYVDNILINY